MKDNNKPSLLYRLFHREPKEPVDILKEESIESPWKAVRRKFYHNRLGMIGLIGFLIILLTVIIGSIVVPFNPYYAQFSMKNVSPGSGYMNVPDALLKEGVADIDSGNSFSVGLSTKGKVYVWGHDNEYNVLHMPQEVKKQIEEVGATHIATGNSHVIVALKNGEIVGWGSNSFQQNHGDVKANQLARKEGVKKLTAANELSVLLTEKGTVYAWGSTLASNLKNILTRKFQGHVVDIQQGSFDILCLLDDGALQLIGKTGTEVQTNMPDELKNGQVKVVSVGRTTLSAAAVDEQGKFYIWGSKLDHLTPPPAFDGTPVQIDGGSQHLTVLTDKGKVYAWGVDNFGTTSAPSGEGYTRVFSNFFTNYAFKDDGSYKAWGLDGFSVGTDQYGRDLWTRIIHGGKTTLLIALIAVVLDVILGVIVGLISGFYGGWVDNFLMRFSEIIASFPFYPLIITLSATLPANVSQYARMALIMVILGLIGWTSIARLVRGELLAEREKDYVTAAKALGLKESHIILSHIFPNIVSIVIVQATLGYAGNLLTEAGLSFLGFGVLEPYPSWGNMLTAAQNTEVVQLYWWQWIVPGLAVFLTALTVNLVGDALRDALDPKLAER